MQRLDREPAMIGTHWTSVPPSRAGFDREPWLVEAGLEGFQASVSERMGRVQPLRDSISGRGLTTPNWSVGRLRRPSGRRAFVWIPDARVGWLPVTAYLVDGERAGVRGAPYLRASIVPSSALRSPIILRHGRQPVLGAIADGSPHLLARLTPERALPGLARAIEVNPRQVDPGGTEVIELDLNGTGRPPVACARVSLGALLIPFANRGEAWALFAGASGKLLGWARIADDRIWRSLNDVWAPLAAGPAGVPPAHFYARDERDPRVIHPVELSRMVSAPVIAQFIEAAARLGISRRVREM
jgi:hypothetical protein